MIRALGVNVDNMIVLGLALSNGLIALAGRAARAVSGLRRRADGHRHGRVGAGEHHHRRGAGRRAASSGFVITGARHGLGAVPAARGACAARRARPERSEAGHGRVRVPRARPAVASSSGDAAGARRRTSARSDGDAGRSERAYKTFNAGHAERGARAARRRPHDRRGLVRHRHRHERLGQVDAAERRGRRRSRSTAGTHRCSTAPTSRAGPSIAARRSSAASFRTRSAARRRRMSIAENLALAARRGQPRGLGWALQALDRCRSSAIACAS